jgi:hypothetical protein
MLCLLMFKEQDMYFFPLLGSGPVLNTFWHHNDFPFPYRFRSVPEFHIEGSPDYLEQFILLQVLMPHKGTAELCQQYLHLINCCDLPWVPMVLKAG